MLGSSSVVLAVLCGLLVVVDRQRRCRRSIVHASFAGYYTNLPATGARPAAGHE